MGDLVQPARQGTPIADRRPVSRQREEGRLECILGVMLAIEDMAADPQDPGAMTLHQEAEGVLGPWAPVVQEPGQQHLVGRGSLTIHLDLLTAQPLRDSPVHLTPPPPQSISRATGRVFVGNC